VYNLLQSTLSTLVCILEGEGNSDFVDLATGEKLTPENLNFHMTHMMCLCYSHCNSISNFYSNLSYSQDCSAMGGLIGKSLAKGALYVIGRHGEISECSLLHSYLFSKELYEAPEFDIPFILFKVQKKMHKYTHEKWRKILPKNFMTNYLIRMFQLIYIKGL